MTQIQTSESEGSEWSRLFFPPNRNPSELNVTVDAECVGAGGQSATSWAFKRTQMAPHTEGHDFIVPFALITLGLPAILSVAYNNLSALHTTAEQL